MTRAELRAGMVRLGAILAGLVGLSAAVAEVWAAWSHNAFHTQFAAVLSLEAVALLVIGVVAWRRAFPVQRPRRGEGRELRILSAEQRPGGEAQAIGIILLGFAFFIAALLIG